jgi:hypothetical protein
MAARDQALEKLYRARLAEFVAERKRLAADLKAKGDEPGAKDLANRRRPTTSAWTVNQLWWQARDAFDDMLAAARKVRKGDLTATGELREANATLRKRATALLKESGAAVTEALLRRVSTTLSAIAASGGFGPDEPGTLVADRDPPGFEGVQTPAKVIPLPARARSAAAKPEARGRDDTATRRTDELEEKRREHAERERRKEESRRIRTSLYAAKTEAARHDRRLAALRKDVAAAERAAADARETVADLERQLADLDG